MLTLVLFVGLFVIYGIAYIVFAFVQPPGFLSSFFRVPSYFGLLPDRLVAPVGRTFVGLVILGVTGFAVARGMIGH